MSTKVRFAILTLITAVMILAVSPQVHAFALAHLTPDAGHVYNYVAEALGYGSGVSVCAFTSTALNAYVKRTYDPKYVEASMTSRIDSTLKAIKRVTDGSGDNFSWLADADDSFNGSADFTIAQGAATANANAVGSKFLSDWNDYSAVAQITASVIGKTRNNDGAWQRAVDVAMKKTINSIAHANAVFWQGQGWGEVSTIASVSGSTFVPGIASDITKYVKGMPLHFSLTLHSDLLRSTTVRYVTGVSYTPGSELVTLDGSLAGVSAVNGDTAFIAGCRQNSTTPTRIALCGMGAWFPNQAIAADTANTTIFGIDRSTNSRLYGTFINATSGGNILGALIDGVQEAVTVGDVTKLECYASKATFAAVAKDLQGAVLYTNNPESKSIGTNRLRIYADGNVEAFLQVSRTTNDTVIWGYDPGQVVLKSIGDAPHIDNEDGLTLCRMSASQSYESRWFQQGIFEVKNPVGGLRVQLV